MKYAKEVIDLLAAYPGRDFRMIEIVRYTVTADQDIHRARKGIQRVLQSLSESGYVIIRPPRAMRGSYALYRWKSET